MKPKWNGLFDVDPRTSGMSSVAALLEPEVPAYATALGGAYLGDGLRYLSLLPEASVNRLSRPHRMRCTSRRNMATLPSLTMLTG